MNNNDCVVIPIAPHQRTIEETVIALETLVEKLEMRVAMLEAQVKLQ